MLDFVAHGSVIVKPIGRMNVISEFSNMVKTTIPGSYVSHTEPRYGGYSLALYY